MKKIFYAALLATITMLMAVPRQADAQKSKSAKSTNTNKYVSVKEIVSERNFDKTIKNKKNLVLVDFWASWCGPCKMIAPNIEAIAQELDGKVVVAKYNIEQEDASVITKRYNISAIPCLVVFENGKEIGRNVGYMTKTELLTWLKKYMK